MPKNPDTSGARKRSIRRDKALRGASSRATRWIPGTLAVVLLGGVIAGGTSLGWQAPALDATARPAELSAAATTLVCPPAPRLPEGAGEGEDVDFAPFSSDDTSRTSVVAISDLAGNLPGITHTADTTQNLTPSQDEEIQQGTPATGGPDGVAVTQGFAQRQNTEGQAAIIEAEPLGGQSSLAAASSNYSASDGDLAGVTTANCAPPAHEHWLTGATTTVGTTSVLNLTNPTSTPATVDLTLHGATGLVTAAGTSNIVLDAQETRSFVVAGLAPNEQNVGVSVSAAGGAVSATINQYTLDGLDPVGITTIQPAATGTSLMIPGVLIGEDPAQTPAVNLTALNTAATVEIQVLGEDGPVDGGNDVVNVPAHGSATAELDLPEGVYSVRITSDAAVTAAATSAAGDDIATISAVTALGLDQVVAASDQLILAANDEATLDYAQVSSDGEIGETQTLEMSADSSTVIDLADNTVGVRLQTSSSVYAGTVTTTGNGIGAHALVPASASRTGVPVRLGY